MVEPQMRSGRRFRKRGEKILHSKYIVICVIFLTISDCALVIGELILDLYSVKISLQESVGRSNRFLNGLKLRYPDQFQEDRMLNIDYVMDRILSVEINWDNVVDFGRQNLTNNLYSNFLPNHTRHKRSSQDSVEYLVHDQDVNENGSLFKPIYKHSEEVGHSREEYIAHCLHYASLSVLSILLLEVVKPEVEARHQK
ncbi:hypothetical protein LOTGIDRAFT_163270 [Lottia gigantea]|uniref:Uncharacterized protein n=1 Tax=Lottia gigantea TaxID=225164 RepID=V4A4C4_LOTGI|nr:hypothetical protein LOTGIDRAFT_163270 [Lottia gigantea]ESO91547.1 hypothetical protein LOTGIDRAFT_163270 [Lottia gigantea]